MTENDNFYNKTLIQVRCKDGLLIMEFPLKAHLNPTERQGLESIMTRPEGAEILQTALRISEAAGRFSIKESIPDMFEERPSPAPYSEMDKNK